MDNLKLLDEIARYIKVVTKTRHPKYVIDATDFKSHKERVEELAKLAERYKSVDKFYVYPYTKPGSTGYIWVATEIELTEEQRLSIDKIIRTL